MPDDDYCSHPSSEVILHQCQHDIATYGWHCIAVGASPNFPPYAYTIGLYTTYHHPDLVIAGLMPKLSHEILQNVVALIKEGRRIMDGDERNDILSGVPVRFRDAATSIFPLHVADAYYQTDVSCLQVIWPDKEGFFPDEDGCDETISDLQNNQR